MCGRKPFLLRHHVQSVPGAPDEADVVRREQLRHHDRQPRDTQRLSRESGTPSFQLTALINSGLNKHQRAFDEEQLISR